MQRLMSIFMLNIVFILKKMWRRCRFKENTRELVHNCTNAYFWEFPSFFNSFFSFRYVTVQWHIMNSFGKCRLISSLLGDDDTYWTGRKPKNWFLNIKPKKLSDFQRRQFFLEIVLWSTLDCSGMLIHFQFWGVCHR
jgi:hypothetical protein